MSNATIQVPAQSPSSPINTRRKAVRPGHADQLQEFFQRVTALEDGRWMITLTVDGGFFEDWTATRLGKVER